MLVREIHKSIMVWLTMLNFVFRKALAIANSLTADYNCLVTAWCKPYTKSLTPAPAPRPLKNFRASNASTRASSQFCLIFPFESSAEARRGMRMKASGVSSQPLFHENLIQQQKLLRQMFY